VLDAPAVSALVAAGYIVVTAGGGGIPVVRDGDTVRGVEAVIDKDLTAAVLARAVGAEALVIATDVENVALGFGTPAQRALGEVSVAELRGHAAVGQFASGSMGPKVEAVCPFRRGGRPACRDHLTGPDRRRRARSRRNRCDRRKVSRCASVF
jgi:carbamate kinase